MTLRSPFRPHRKIPRNTRFQRLWRGDRGAVAILFLFGSVAVLATSLGAMDLVRHNVVQGKLQHALDGATLSAGRNLGNLTPTPGTVAADQWQQDAFQYFNSNMPAGFLGSSIKPEDLKINYTEETTSTSTGNYVTGQVISMDATGILPLISVGFLNVATFNIQASNQAVRRMRQDLELVMALDNTGSMAGTPLDTLKSAAHELTAIVLGASAASTVPGRVFIGLVPFADTVNVGNTAITRQWLTLPNGQPSYSPVQANFIQNSWMGCITEPAAWGGSDLPASALTPSAGFQPLVMAAPTTVRDKQDLGLSNNNPAQRVAPDTPTVKQPKTFQATGAYTDRHIRTGRDSSGQILVYGATNPSNCQSSRLTRFLTDDQAALDSAIDAMQANGNTLIPTGLLWAWRMLNPKWRPAWGDADKPRDADPQNLRKAIVLLTDGDNQPPGSVSNSTSGNSALTFTMNYDMQQCSDNKFTSGCSIVPKTYTTPTKGLTQGSASQAPMHSLKMQDLSGAATSTSIGWGNTTGISGPSVDNYLTQLCNNVKNDGNGIKIYTVALGSGVGSATGTLLNNCSSGAGYFYSATDVSTLPDVFRAIAGAMIELRLTK